MYTQGASYRSLSELSIPLPHSHALRLNSCLEHAVSEFDHDTFDRSIPYAFLHLPSSPVLCSSEKLNPSETKEADRISLTQTAASLHCA